MGGWSLAGVNGVVWVLFLFFLFGHEKITGTEKIGDSIFFIFSQRDESAGEEEIHKSEGQLQLKPFKIPAGDCRLDRSPSLYARKGG